MKLLSILALLCCALSVAAQTTLKLKIDANLSNQERLLRALNSHASKSKITFALADTDYDYRIAFGTSKTPRTVASGSNGNVTGTTAEYPTGDAVVYNSHDQEIFRFSHVALWPSEGAAINSSAKEIFHRLQKWRSKHPN